VSLALRPYRINTNRCLDSEQVSDLDNQEIQYLTFASSVPGESPPLPPRVFFGRDELVERVVGLAENLTPIALIGAGGIGKTSTILTVLHDDRIKQRFGDNRWFIRCDQFPASRPNFLHRLSKVIGAGIENPEDLTPLRRFLSSKRMLIVLDNAESVLGMQGTDGREIYAIVDELSWFSNICLCITSRISIIPPHCETLDIPTLSMGAACDTFYRIYNHGGQSDVVNDILAQLDFHPLCITLLATVAQQNKWDTNRLTREWERRRTGVLDTRHSGSLATTIELSLASPMFQELGPDARGLLEVVAFFPQGVDENNLGWLFPTISNGSNIFDQFCILSLTHRSNGFIAMLAPLRDYLRPKDPKSSPLLSTTKECYFARLSVDVDPDRPGFGEAQWITSEDVNIEHLLDVFSAIDATSGGIWDACANFMEHLFWHKPRLIVLGPKIESLPDDHPSKPQCLYQLSKLFHSVGNWVERKRLLVHALGSWRERGDDHWVALTLSSLSDANRHMGIHKEGIQQAEGASEIFERVGDTARQARCLVGLAWLLYDDDQLDTAEETASRAINLLSERDEKFQACRCHRVLGEIYHSKGETEKAIGNFELALGIAASSDWHKEMCLIHFSLVLLFAKEGAFDDAHTHIERAKSHAVNYPYLVARAVQLKALVLYRQHRPEEARSEASSTLHMFRKLGAAKDAEYTRMLLGWIDEEVDGLVTPGESDDDGELLETVSLVMFIDSSCLDLEGSHIRMVTSMEPPSLPCTLLQVYPPAGRLRTVPPAYCLLLPHPHRHRRTRWRGLTPPWITNTRPHARSTRRRSTRFWGGF